MISRRTFLISVSSTLTLAGCASIPTDATQRRGGVADPAATPPTPWGPQVTTDAGKNAPPQAPAAQGRYTCTMHPEIDLPAPGNCPKCGMPLVPRTAGGSR
jgi:hypothetical protein